MDIGTLRILLKAEDQASQVLDGAEKKAGGFGKALGGVGKIAGGFVLGSGLLSAPGSLFEMAQGAAEDAASMGRLEQAVANAEGSFDSHAGAVEQAIKNGQDLAFSDDQVRDALALMTATTGDADEALDRLGTAQDLARGTGMDLVTAAKLLGRVNDENINVLSRYGIQVEKGASAQELLNAVDQKFAGQAGTFAESDAGKMAIAADKVGELQESLGAYLIPALVAVVSAVTMFTDGLSGILSAAQPVVGFIQGNLTPILLFLTPAFVALGVALLTTVVPALIAKAAALWASVAAWIALNTAMLPIIAVILLIGAVIVGLYLAWQNNLFGIRDITNAVIGWLTPYLQTAWELIRTGLELALTAIATAWNLAWSGLQVIIETVWPIIQTIVTTAIGLIQAGIETALGVITAVWGVVWPAAQATIETVWPIIQSVIETAIGIVQSVIETALGAIQAIWDTVWPAIQGTAETIWGAIQGIVETAIGVVQSTIETVMGTISGAWDTVWGTIRDTADTIWGEIKSLVETAIGAVRDTLDTVTGTISDAWDTAWNGIKTALDTVWNAGLGIVGIVATGIGAVKSTISNAYEGITGAWSRIWDTITGAISSARDTILGILRDIIGAANGVIDRINGFIGGVNSALEFSFSVGPFDMPGPIPDIPGMSLSVDAPDIATIPRLAAGGIVRRPTLALVGEAGPEAVIPLDRLAGAGQGVAVNYYGPVTIEARDRSEADRAGRDIGWAVGAALRARGV